MYFPKSQITPNLYTNGNEFFLYGESYIGYYFKVSTGRYFTGKTPDDRPNLELFQLTQNFWDSQAESETTGREFVQFADNYDGLVYQNQTQQSKNNFIYNTLKPQQQETFLPYYFLTLPTQQDYQNGEFQRYFCKKTNEVLYIEISKKQFDKLVAKDPQILWQLYKPFTITWLLTGNKETVAKINKNNVELASFRQKLPRLVDYLKFDFTKYYQ
jgi:hypothetical protein